METAFGQYNLLERIAAGGMGEVYLARITRGDAFQKIVAVKKILPELTENREFMRQFENEARFAARLNHANIVSVYDFGTIGNETFLAMEYVDGVDLATLIDTLALEKRRIALPEGLNIISGLARGLDYLHRLRDPKGNELGLIHQDISPQNVLISSEAEIKITDFGLVRAVQKSGQPLEGRLLGKLAYMAPEQFRRQQPDRRCDIFSVGCVMYEMFAGRLLLGNDAQSTDLSVRGAAIASGLATLGDIVPEPVKDIIRRCVESDPKQRYEDARSLRFDIQAEVSRLGAMGLHPDVGALVRECPQRRHEPNIYLEADRTLVADKPIFKQDSPTEKKDSDAPPSAGPASRRWLWITMAFVLLMAASAAAGGFWWFAMPAGHVQLNDIPEGATLRMDDATVPVTGADMTIPVFGRNTSHSLVLEKRFFTAYKKEFDFSRSDMVTLQPSLKRITSAVEIVTDPPGAAISFDGTLLKKASPLRLKDVPLGKPFKIRLELPGLVPFTGVYTLTEQKPLKVNHHFESIAASAIITTKPMDCILMVDGKRMAGKSPFTLKGLAPGTELRIVAHRKGHRSTSVSMAPQRGKDNAVTITLPTVEPRLKVESAEAFSITMDGKPMRNGTPLKRNGSHILMVSDGKGQTLALRLKYRERQSRRGIDQFVSMNINARPWAAIQLNKKALGETPISGVRVSPGSHTLSFTNGNKKTHTLRLQLSL